jgi:hypothetical protein
LFNILLLLNCKCFEIIFMTIIKNLIKFQTEIIAATEMKLEKIKANTLVGIGSGGKTVRGGGMPFAVSLDSKTAAATISSASSSIASSSQQQDEAVVVEEKGKKRAATTVTTPKRQKTAAAPKSGRGGRRPTRATAAQKKRTAVSGRDFLDEEAVEGDEGEETEEAEEEEEEEEIDPPPATQPSWEATDSQEMD